MGWKNWPSWIKGSILFLLGFSILYPLVINSIQNCPPFLSESPHTLCMLGLWIAVILYFPAHIILNLINFYYWPIYSDIIGKITEFIVSLIIFTLIGAFIGWIVGRTKSKK